MTGTILEQCVHKRIYESNLACNKARSVWDLGDGYSTALLSNSDDYLTSREKLIIGI